MHLGQVQTSLSDTLPDATVKILNEITSPEATRQACLPLVLEPQGTSPGQAKSKQIRTRCYEENRDINCPAPASDSSASAEASAEYIPCPVL